MANLVEKEQEEEDMHDTPESQKLVSDRKRRHTVINLDKDRSSSQIYRELSQVDDPVKLKFKMAIEGNDVFFENIFKNGEEKKKQAVLDDKYGESNLSVLHLAAKYCHLKLCKIFIEDFKFDVGILCGKHFTPLHYLVFYNNERQTVHFDNIPETDIRNRAASFSTERRIDQSDCLKYLIEKLAPINAKDIRGLTPLHYAALKNNSVAASILIDQKSNDNNKCDLVVYDNQNMTPLHLACKHGNMEIVQCLLEAFTSDQKSCLIELNKSRTLPIHCACAYTMNNDAVLGIVELILNEVKEIGKIEAVRKLIKFQDGNNQSPMDIAILNNFVNLVRTFIKFLKIGNTSDDKLLIDYPMHFAAQTANEEIIEILVNHGAHLNKFNIRQNTPIHTAASLNKVKFISYFKNQRIHDQYKETLKTKNYLQFTPLMCAAFNGHIESLKELYDPLPKLEELIRSENTDCDDRNIFHLCACRNQWDCFKLLIEPFVNDVERVLFSRDKEDNTVLHLAAQFGHLTFVQDVLEKFKDEAPMLKHLVLFKNSEEETFLHLACLSQTSDDISRNFFKYVLDNFDSSLLLKSTDYKLNTPLHVACENNNITIVETFLKYDSAHFKIDFNLKNIDGQTAFDVACENGNLDIVKCISKYKPLCNFINLNDIGQDLPAQIACRSGNLQLLKYLIREGADPEILDKKSDRNLLDFALDAKQSNIVRYLIKTQISLLKTSDQLKILCEEMPDVVESILDSSVNKKEKTFNFGYLDPSFSQLLKKENKIKEIKTINDLKKLHPLYKIAKSDNKTLLKHEAVDELLQFKWRFWPKLIYYTSLVLYVLFVSLLTYQIIIGENSISLQQKSLENSQNTPAIQHQILKLREYEDEKNWCRLVLIFLFYCLLTFHCIKELVQIYLSRIRYFYYIDNWLELITCILAVVYITILSTVNSILKSVHEEIETINCNKKDLQWQIGSICGLSAWLSLALYIDKLPEFGIYAVMFRRILSKSFKILPLFIIMLYGFSLSFSIQNHNVINSFNSTTSRIVHTLGQVVGELGIDGLGIGESLVKQLVFFLFMSLMCIILLNLLIGISIGEITSVMDDADTRLITEKIKFTLNVQATFYQYLADDSTFVYEAERKNYQFYVKMKEWFRRVFMMKRKKEKRERMVISRGGDWEKWHGIELKLRRIELSIESLSKQLKINNKI